MRDPLLAPLAAIATGILLSRLVPFGTRELGAVIAAYVILTLICLWRRARVLAFVSTLLALIAVGALVAVAHRMPPAPQMDTEGALLILSGCVVEPSAISADRDQFVLELEPGARVRVSLFVPEGKQPPVLRYGQRVEFDARVRPTTTSTIRANSTTRTTWRAREFIGQRRRAPRPPSRSCRVVAADGS